MYKLVISDLDGTLLAPDHKVTTHTIETINKLNKKGIHFCIATGRHYEDVKKIARNFNFPMYLITSNGARIHDLEGNKIYSANIEPKILKELIDKRNEYNLEIHIYHDTKWYVEKDYTNALKGTKQSNFQYTITNFEKISLDNICKLFIKEVDGKIENLLQIEKQLNKLFGDDLNVAFSSSDCLEIMPKGVNKGRAMEIISAKLGLNPANVIAFGDGMNDCEILDMVGCGMMMSNASERLKNSLPDNKQCKANSENGVAEFLIKEFKL